MFSKRVLTAMLAAAILVMVISSLPNFLGFAEGIWGTSKTTGHLGIQASPEYLQNEIQISPTSDPEAERHLPAVAYNSVHDEFLVVWHNEWPGGHRDIYARRISSSGKLLSWFAVSAGTNNRLQPDVVYNATNDEYLVVWMFDVNGDGSVYEIWGRIVAWNSAYQKPEFQIITWPNRSFWTPKAAWNSVSNEYMVVWNAVDATTTTPTDIAHAILSPTGVKLFGAVITSADLPHQVDLAFNAAKDEYLVVWRRMQAPADGDIMAARLGGFSGQVISPPGVITVSNTPQDQRNPSVATNQHNTYIVAWEHVYASAPCCDWDIKSRELDNNGNLLGSEMYVANSADDELSPAVAAREGPEKDYLVAVQRDYPAGEGVLAFHRRGNQIGVLDIAQIAFWDHEAPALAMGRVSSLIAYTGDASGDPNIHQHIYARRWVPSSVFLPLTLHR